ncbi:unnamed protein product [Phytophthora lilii]|uniref:Unnamed protein product n=1 Tax=Phytophthora lilii TaxID=2077276 RepID=A0A9W6WUG1_9STRA|nr:unnamed protein product [Phytophthora lilii]
MEEKTPSTEQQRGGEQELEAGDEVGIGAESVETGEAMEKRVERQEEEEEEDDIGMDVEEPCFNLLGSGAAVFAAPAEDAAEEDEVVVEKCDTDETKSRKENEGVDEDDDEVVVSSPPRYPGFISASKLRIGDLPIEEKLASAGLDLSDSDEDRDELRRLKGRNKEDEAWEDKWVCHICTNLNPQSAMQCTSCSCKRYRDVPRTPETTSGSDLLWACHICTNLNSPELTECDACMEKRKTETPVLQDLQGETWACNACTTYNAPGTTHCETCDLKRGARPKNVARKGRECPVCTNVNSPGNDTPDDHFVDLSSSPPARKSSYNIDDNHTPIASPHDERSRESVSKVVLVKKLKLHQPPRHAAVRRPAARSGKQRLPHDEVFIGAFVKAIGACFKVLIELLSTARFPASSVGAKASKAKRTKKAGTPARRASSATTFSSSVNHYADVGADIGEDISTMAWEGIGSAGYL